jgi:hypothetical protein
MYNNQYVYQLMDVAGLNLVLQQHSTAEIAKSKADIAKKSSYFY